MSLRKQTIRVVDPEDGTEFLCSDDGPTRSGEFIGENLPRREELQFVVDALNGKRLFYPGPREDFNDYDRMLREMPPILKRIVDAWLPCQKMSYGLSRFFEANPKIDSRVARYWKDNPTVLTGAGVGGGAAIAFQSSPGCTPDEEALRFFLLLVTNPLCDKLTGPCVRCKKYFVRDSAKNTRYCSRSCATRSTALTATKKRRQEEHADKLLRASEAARQWTAARTRLNWKQWVATKCTASEITVKFLTRAVNKGELEEPVRRK